MNMGKAREKMLRCDVGRRDKVWGKIINKFPVIYSFLYDSTDNLSMFEDDADLTRRKNYIRPFIFTEGKGLQEFFIKNLNTSYQYEGSLIQLYHFYSALKTNQKEIEMAIKFYRI